MNSCKSIHGFKLTVGAVLGRWVGKVVGLPDGAVVGLCVGAVGDLVGTVVGSAVGTLCIVYSSMPWKEAYINHGTRGNM